MGNWRDSIPSKWLKAADLDGKPHLMTIKGFSVEAMNDGSKCPCVWFREPVAGEHKGFILNVTNGKSIEAISGSKDTDNWKGKVIVIYPTETDLKGERVDCIRVRAPKPGSVAAPAPEPEPEQSYQADDSDVPF